MSPKKATPQPHHIEAMPVQFLEVGEFLMVPNGDGEWINTKAVKVMCARINNVIEIPIGHVNDLASIPRIARGIIGVNGPHRPAAVVHDYLYEMHGKYAGDKPELDRHTCDMIFYDIMQTSRGSYFLALSHEQQLVLAMANRTPEQLGDMDKPLVDRGVAMNMYKAVRIAGGFFF